MGWRRGEGRTQGRVPGGLLLAAILLLAGSAGAADPQAAAESSAPSSAAFVDPAERAADARALEDIDPHVPRAPVATAAPNGPSGRAADEAELAAPPATAAPDPAAADPLEAARSRYQRALAAYRDMLQRNYPRGDARRAIVDERDAARAALDRLLDPPAEPAAPSPAPAS